jgi:hypothetical protein
MPRVERRPHLSSLTQIHFPVLCGWPPGETHRIDTNSRPRSPSRIVSNMMVGEIL